MDKRLGCMIAALVAIAALVVAGCGGGSSTSSSGSATGGNAGGGEEGGGGTKLEPKTIALVDFQGSSPVDLATDEVVKGAAKKLGWEVTYQDAEGEPEKAAQAISAAVTQGVDGIIVTSGEANYFRPALNQAKQKGIPVITTAGGSPDPLFAAGYVEEKPAIAIALNEFMLKEQPEAQIAAIQASIVKAGTVRYEELDRQVEENGKAKIVQAFEPEITNLSSWQKSVSDVLTAHPEVTAVWSVFDNFTQSANQAIHATGSKAKLYSFYASPSNLELLEKPSALTAVADNSLPVTGAMAVNALLYYLEEGTEIPANYVEEHPLTVTIYTRKNLPKGGTVWSPETLLAPYVKQWEKSFPGELH